MTTFKTVTNTVVPAIGLGTWQLTGKSCVRGVKAALELGYRHLDTAQAYDNEQQVGAGLAQADVSREDVFLTTKVWRTNLAPNDVRRSVQESLDRLGTEYVDLLLIHWPNDAVDMADTLETLAELQAAGKTRSIGVSNFTGAQLEEALSITPELLTNQVEAHIYWPQKDMIKKCAENDMLLTAYSPLARGDAIDEPVLQDIAADHDASAAQVAIAWLIQQDPVVAIPKTGDRNHQEQNLAAEDLNLTVEDIARIEDIEKRKKYVDPGFAPW